MRQPLRRVRTLCRARRMLRDLAAGEFAIAEAETRRAAREREEMEARREGLLEDAVPRLLEAEGPNPMLMLELEREAAERLVIDAEKRREAAAALSEDRRAALRRREAELRTAERILERAAFELEAAVHREEQRAIDDLVASRGRRAGSEA